MADQNRGFDPQALDRWITGNYGEDQFRGDDAWEQFEREEAENITDEAFREWHGDELDDLTPDEVERTRAKWQQSRFAEWEERASQRGLGID